MPPYAGEQSTTMVATREDLHNAYYADLAAPAKAAESSPLADDATAEESQASPTSGKLDFIYDFNPCHSMSSAVFKVRDCTYCGKSCSKLRGYKKEIVESSTGEMEKIYFHKWCSQLKDWKATHAMQWKRVMDSMMANFQAAERAVAEERARQEAALRQSQSPEMEALDDLATKGATSRSADGPSSNGKQSGFGQTIKAFFAALGCKGNNAVNEEATQEQH